MSIEQTQNDLSENDIDLFQLWQTLVDGKLLIGFTMVICLALATALAFIMTPKFEGKLTASFADEGKSGGGMGGLASQLGGLAEMAGVSVGGGGSRDSNLAFLKSRYLVETFIKDNDLLPVHYAKKWDAKAKKWNVDDPDDVPTMGKAYKLFSAKILDIQNDKKAGTITLTVTWKDREQAARWANDLIRLANSTLRQRAIDDTQLSLNYLHEELGKTSLVDIQNTIHRVAETQIKTAMMANTQEQFAFKIIDPAVVADPDAFVKPKRPLMIALGGVGGLFLGVLLVFMRQAIAKRRSAQTANVLQGNA